MPSSKIKKNYNFAQTNTDIFIPFNDILTAQAITFSTLTSLTGTTDESNFPIEDVPIVISNTDSGAILHAGNDTQFDRIYTWRPPYSGILYKFGLHLALGLNVSAQSAGNFNLGTVVITISQQNPTRVIYQQTYLSGATNITATGTNVFVIDDTQTPKAHFEPDQPVTIRIVMTVTTGTGTRQEGLIPFYTKQLAANPKIFSLSGIILTYYPDEEAANAVVIANPEAFE